MFLAGSVRRFLLARLLARTEDWLAKIINQTIQILVVLLADVLRQLTAFPPRDVPCHRERPRVRARIGDRRLVVQRLFVRTRPPLDDFHLVGMRVPEVIQPAVLVEALVLNDERVGVLPTADRVAEIRGIQLVALRELATVHVDLTPDVRRTFKDHHDALVLWLLDDLHLVRRGHHPRAAGWKTVAFRVVLRLVLGVVVVNRSRPRHPRHPRLGLRSATAASASTTTCATATRASRSLRLLDLGEHLAVFTDDPHRHVGDVRHRPHALLTRDASEIHGAVRKTRSGGDRTGLAAASAAGALSLGSGATLAFYGCAGGTALLRAQHPGARREHDDRRRAEQRGTKTIFQERPRY